MDSLPPFDTRGKRYLFDQPSSPNQREVQHCSHIKTTTPVTSLPSMLLALNQGELPVTE